MNKVLKSSYCVTHSRQNPLDLHTTSSWKIGEVGELFRLANRKISPKHAELVEVASLCAKCPIVALWDKIIGWQHITFLHLT
jgi:hypothetical protein